MMTVEPMTDEEFAVAREEILGWFKTAFQITFPRDDADQVIKLWGELNEAQWFATGEKPSGIQAMENLREALLASRRAKHRTANRHRGGARR
jgi:hypothetical protein